MDGNTCGQCISTMCDKTDSGVKKKVLTHLESGEDAGGHLQNSCQCVVCVKHGLLVLLQQAISFSIHFAGPLQRT